MQKFKTILLAGSILPFLAMGVPAAMAQDAKPAPDAATDPGAGAEPHHHHHHHRHHHHHWHHHHHHHHHKMDAAPAPAEPKN